MARSTNSQSSRIGLKEIASQAGVSVATVSMALSDHPNINAQTKETIQRLCVDIGYISADDLENRKRARYAKRCAVSCYLCQVPVVVDSGVSCSTVDARNFIWTIRNRATADFVGLSKMVLGKKICSVFFFFIQKAADVEKKIAMPNTRG